MTFLVAGLQSSSQKSSRLDWPSISPDPFMSSRRDMLVTMRSATAVERSLFDSVGLETSTSCHDRQTGTKKESGRVHEEDKKMMMKKKEEEEKK